ncbi:S1C family serine protease [Acholeplasma granularum]|uniref:S1C family serine protease n=1 Tax=Acholeplasma granularum TaxID=264635 RepID=UPI0004BC2143|nr:S1C family serine protease [Acholeplasma granularum]
MKKILLIIISFSLIMLTGCMADEIEHQLRDKPTSLEYQELVASLKDSTVSLIGYQLEFEVGLGSGLIYDKEPSKDDKYYYYVVTNYHVVSAMSYVEVVTNQGNIEFGDIYAYTLDSETDNDDIAIVRFESSYDYPLIEILPLNEEQAIQVQLKVGQFVFGVGTPVDKINQNLSTNLGIITDLSQTYVSHSANINPGNSGGPLFSYDGTFIGINTQRVEVIDGETVYLINESIHVNKVAEVIKRRLSQVTPKLGIVIMSYIDFVTDDYIARYGDKAKGFNPLDHVKNGLAGVVVTTVNQTRASFGILEKYDVILEANGIRVTNNEQLGAALNGIESGRTYEFLVSRKNKETNIYEQINLEVIIP